MSDDDVNAAFFCRKSSDKRLENCRKDINKEGKIIRYKTERKFSFSLKYQLSILVTLYLGYLLNAKLYTVLAQNIFLKHLIIWTSVSAIILLLFYRTNFVLILVIFLASVIALSAMAAATRPVLRAKTYKRLKIIGS